MNPLLLNMVLGVVALLSIYCIWIAAHLLARYRLGERKLGCRGPTTDDEGNEICCHTGDACDRNTENSDTCGS